MGRKTVKKSERMEEFEAIFRGVDENERKLVAPLISECVWLEEQMEATKRLPFIRVHPKDPSIQKSTPAARLYKEYATSYMNAVRILLNTLRKVESDAQDELLRRLEEFTG